MFPSLRRALVGAAALALSLSSFAVDTANAYPDQPIKIIVTFPPGGSADIVIRALQPVLSETLRQTIIIENKSGAGGNIGIGAVAKSAPDGYTLGVAAAGVLTVNPHLNPAAMPFDPLKDLVPVTMLAEIPFVLVASQQSAITSVADVIAKAKAEPQGLSIGHGGNGTAMHLTSALFNQKAGVGIQLIAYRGTAPASVDVLAGHIPLAVLDIPASKQLIIDGKLKALGVSAAKRVVFLPDVPPLAEQGLSEFELVGWFGLVAPAGTSPEIVNTLNAAFVKALSDPAAIEKIRVLGAEPAPTSPEAFAKFIRSESAKWGKLIAETGIKANSSAGHFRKRLSAFDPDQCDGPFASRSWRAKGLSVAHSESLSHTETRLNRPVRPILRDADGRLPHESEFLKQLGIRVREMRALRGMSRRELARLSGLSERFVAQIEAGKGNVSIVRLLRIAMVFRGDGPAA